MELTRQKYRMESEDFALIRKASIAHEMAIKEQLNPKPYMDACIRLWKQFAFSYGFDVKTVRTDAETENGLTFTAVPAVVESSYV